MQNQTDEKTIEERLREFYAGEGFTYEEIDELADTERSIQAVEKDQTIPEEDRKQSARMMRMAAFPAIGEKAYYESLPNDGSIDEDATPISSIRWGL